MLQAERNVVSCVGTQVSDERIGMLFGSLLKVCSELIDMFPYCWNLCNEVQVGSSCVPVSIKRHTK